MKLSLVLLLCIPLLLCLGQKKKKSASETKAELTALAHYDLSIKHPKQFILPKRLSEASGLTFTEDGRLFSHGDEDGVICQVDYAKGKIVKQFSLGAFGTKGDFEDIAIKGKTFYLVVSNGVVYEFAEGNDGGRVEYKTYKTFLSTKNDVEGLAYDPATDCLLLVCKEFPGKSYNGFRAIYSFSLKTKALSATPRFLIPLKTVTENTAKGEFKPSGIALHPKSGTYFIIAAHGESIIELSQDGALLSQQRINKKANPHPEGIAFAPDLSLLLCNDGNSGSGTITITPYNP
jgi:uncharacterized protein YjiK